MSWKRRTAAVVLGGWLLALAGAATASAHVSVHPSTAVQGSETELTFRVPTELDNAATTKVQVFFPTDTPIPSVSVESIPGWSISVEHASLPKPITTDDGQVTEYTSAVTWTATGGGLPSGQFQDFAVSAGPLPDTSQIVFKALQTYSNGQVVRWVELTPSSGIEPDFPAPALTLTPAGAAAATPAESTVSAETDSTARWLAAIGIAMGLLGLGVGGAVLWRSRHPS
jgi:uncharacterized protein YcnI